MTKNELDLGEQTVKAFLRRTLGWQAMFVPQWAEEKAAATIIQVADGTDGDVAAKEHAAALALYKAISDAGFGERVTLTQCSALAVTVHQAVLKARGRVG